MSQLKLSKYIKSVIIGAGVCGTVICFYVFPFWGNDSAASNPKFLSWYWIWLIFLWITSILCYATLACGWKIADEIGKDNSFSRKNANLLKLISIFAGIAITVTAASLSHLVYKAAQIREENELTI